MAKQTPPSGNQPPDKPENRNFSWVRNSPGVATAYRIIALAGVLFIFSKQAEDVPLSKFCQAMLANQGIQKIGVVNKKKADVFIQKEKPGQSVYAKIPSGQAMLQKPASGSVPYRFPCPVIFIK